MITKTQNFKAIIRKGQSGNQLAVKSSNWYQNELNKYKEGDEVILSISNKKPKRSDQQNAFYWGVYLPMIAKETGEQDTESLHELFKGKFLGREVKKVLGYDVMVKGSTTRLTKADFCEYIRAIESLTGVSAPPVENYL